MEGGHYFITSRKVQAQDEIQGAFVRTTLVGPQKEVEEAKGQYFLHYPPGGYGTEILYEGSIHTDKKHGMDRVVVFRRYIHCD